MKLKYSGLTASGTARPEIRN
ncbi:DUF4222 domain-containing protein, partial [Escherichia coli]